jgi:phage terminase small subunit
MTEQDDDEPYATKPGRGKQYLNKKQELFAKFMAEGCNQLDAYVNAGYEPSSANASTLANKPLVKRRIEELKMQAERRELEFQVMRREAAAVPEKLVEVAEWTFQRVMDMMAENVKLAQIAGEYKAANETLKMMGDSLNMFQKAKADANQGNSTGAQNTLALIGKVTQVLAESGGGSDSGEQNALRPRLDRSGDANAID